MLDKDEGHSGIDGKTLQESCKRLQPSGGCAYANDGECGQRQQVILFGVRCNGNARMLHTRCRFILPVGCLHRRQRRVTAIDGAPRRFFDFSHDSLHAYEPLKGLCILYELTDYASLRAIASIEASRGAYDKFAAVLESASKIERWPTLFAIGIGIGIAIDNQDVKADTDSDSDTDPDHATTG